MSLSDSNLSLSACKRCWPVRFSSAEEPDCLKRCKPSSSIFADNTVISSESVHCTYLLQNRKHCQVLFCGGHRNSRKQHALMSHMYMCSQALVASSDWSPCLRSQVYVYVSKHPQSNKAGHFQRKNHLWRTPCLCLCLRMYKIRN